MPGYLLTIEGKSGAGKTTLANIITDILKSKSIEHVHLGGFESTEVNSLLIKAIKELIKKDRFIRTPWFKETALLLAEFLERIYDNVLPNINKKKTIVFECYYESLIVYQAARLAEEPRFQSWKDECLLKYVNSMVEPFCIDVPKPQLIFYVTANTKVISRRLVDRDNRGYTQRDEYLQERIENMYKLILQNRTNVVEIDTTNLTKDKIKESVENILTQKGVI